MNSVAIIPARLDSSRLPRKVLVDIEGRTMLQRVYAIAEETGLFDQVIVATDSEEVMSHCIRHNMRSMITSASHQSGTDRIAEVAELIDAEIIVNIQGDEPFLEPHCLEAILKLVRREDVKIATLCKEITDQDHLFDYNVVKVVADDADKALLFSRNAIPAQRAIPYRNWLDHSKYYQHLGLYAFKKEELLKVVQQVVHPLEQAEKLEQLRWLGNGSTIHCSVVQSDSFGVDTEEDLDRARVVARLS